MGRFAASHHACIHTATTHSKQVLYKPNDATYCPSTKQVHGPYLEPFF